MSESEIQAQAQDNATTEQRPVIQIKETAASHCELKLNSQTINAEQLFADLKRCLMDQAEKTVWINAENDIVYGSVAEVMATAKRAGAEKIYLFLKPANAAPTRVK
ncbi:MAG: biopolymer transporter ExbD [Acidobacteria bacterium]|nr:biopolymer transporter ExbD [Acidobacteriota bacterium]